MLLICCPIQVNFEQDAVISQMNEYEVLQLLMGECRESLAAYKTSLEEDTKLLQVRRHITPGHAAGTQLMTAGCESPDHQLGQECAQLLICTAVTAQL